MSINSPLTSRGANNTSRLHTLVIYQGDTSSGFHSNHQLRDTQPHDESSISSRRSHFYLPHHGVLKPDSTTTKLRVVFNGSSASTSGYSVNDLMYTGAKLHLNISDVLLWIRRHRHIFATDITKMYRQIKIHKDDWKLQRILWMDDQLNEVPYHLTTVTYGTKAAPFLAVRTLLQLAEDEGHKYTGCAIHHSRQEVAHQLKGLCMAGGFPLAKWHATHLDILKTVTDSEDQVAQIFDPLGFASPVVIKAKILLQELWLHKLQWDDPLPSQLSARWLIIREELTSLAKLSISRWLNTWSDSQVELHGFSDASQLAMAAVIYISVHDSTGATFSLVCSKTKVTLLKRLSIPRLELTAALLLSRLMQYVKATLNMDVTATHMWTDSLVTLSWIRSHASRWKDFVRNRVAQIQELTPAAHWRYIPGTSNPADCASRGLTTAQLQSTRFRGRDHDVHDSLPVRYISPETLEKARLFWIQATQATYFSHELKALQADSPLAKAHAFNRLTAYIDAQGVIRVGGRLAHAALSLDATHPVILPRHSQLSSLIIAHAHQRTLHGGTQLTLSHIRQQYWILGGRAPVKSHILRCVTCARQRGIRAHQLMGQLPLSRVTQARPFTHTGVDYAGPLTVKTWKGRGAKTCKGWICVFVCFSTSTVHLEAVSDYSSEGFIAAYRRFSSRRGIAHTLHSDCGTNFIGADTALKRLFIQSTQEHQRVSHLLSQDNTRWKFNPPATPHMGGKWEAIVKSLKFHLRRTIGEAVLTYEELTTLLTQIEAILNSRPLEPLSDDADDISALTPGHFLVGSPLTTIPEPSLTVQLINELLTFCP
ncbi:PREDICTED: uncharacterized protein LOC105555744 [Vollenhovia emeryi]|uniref:uncharacterized protein LOC105555744 n=1 Tax=Vollenhovia emeryi TaxID=411798 RepID=UPI0005F36F1F|nr:PREDICTED: uncharacterized protein LOC105555744 [Vollenhovia emeryi]